MGSPLLNRFLLPLVLLLVSFIPDLSPVASPFIAAAIRIFGRVLALIALVWCAGLVVKSLAQAHEFSLARSAGAVVLEGFEAPAGTIVAGVPARVRGRVDEDLRDRFLRGVQSYVALAAAHRDGAFPWAPATGRGR